MNRSSLFFVLFIAIFSTAYLSCSSDPCDEVNCGANGTCVEGVCECDEGYLGTNCETEERAKFIGLWKSTDYGCFAASEGISVDFDITRGEGLNELIVNFEAGSTLFLDATFEENTITIPFQDKGTNYEGTMILDNDVLSINIKIDAGLGLLDCNATATL